MLTQICKTCQIEKPVDKYERNSTTSLGYRKICIQCRNKAAAKARKLKAGLTQICKVCEVKKPLDKYERNSAKHPRHRKICMSCRKKDKAKARKLKAEMEAKAPIDENIQIYTTIEDENLPVINKNLPIIDPSYRSKPKRCNTCAVLKTRADFRIVGKTLCGWCFDCEKVKGVKRLKNKDRPSWYQRNKEVAAAKRRLKLNKYDDVNQRYADQYIVSRYLYNNSNKNKGL